MNIIKKWRIRRQQKQRKKELARISSVFGIIDVLFQKHLVFWEDRKQNRLFIAQPMAVVMLAKGFYAWGTFLQNLYLHHTYALQQQTWEKYVLDLQAKAVRERIAHGTRLNPGEADRIRRAVRENVPLDAVPVPEVKPFDFFIIADSEEGDAKAEVTFVGEYNPDTNRIDMVAWEDIKNAFVKESL